MHSTRVVGARPVWPSAIRRRHGRSNSRRRHNRRHFLDASAREQRAGAASADARKRSPPNLNFYAMDPLYKAGHPARMGDRRAFARRSIGVSSRSWPRRQVRVHVSAGGCSTPIRAASASTSIATTNGRRDEADADADRRDDRFRRRERARSSPDRRMARRGGGERARAAAAPRAIRLDGRSARAAQGHHAARRRAERRSRRASATSTATAPTTSSSSIRRVRRSRTAGAEQGELQDRRLRRADRRVPVADRPWLERQPRHLVLADGRARSRWRRQGGGVPEDRALRRDA